MKRQEYLIKVFLNEDDVIDYEYNEEQGDVIVQNNYLICGILEKVKKDLLNLEMDNEELEPPKQEENDKEQDID